MSRLVSIGWMVGVLVFVEDSVSLLARDFEFSFGWRRLLRDGRERVEPTSESSSSVLSAPTLDLHLAPRRSAARADSSCVNRH